MAERRFRDMSLTDGEVEAKVDTYFCSPWKEHRWNASYEAVHARAKRLLPLWRKRGLEELQAIAFEDGKASVWGRP